MPDAVILVVSDGNKSGYRHPHAHLQFPRLNTTPAQPAVIKPDVEVNSSQ